MLKTPLICSLLMAFCLSAVMVGCQPPAKPASETKTPAAKAKGGSGPGSTTGGGTEVPKEKGKAETPKAAEKPAVDAQKADEAPKADGAAKTEEAPK